MAHGQKTHQLPGPTALAARMENISVGGFQIEFAVETSCGHGTMTPRAPEQEHVGHFSGSHRTPLGWLEWKHSLTQMLISNTRRQCGAVTGVALLAVRHLHHSWGGKPFRLFTQAA